MLRCRAKLVPDSRRPSLLPGDRFVFQVHRNQTSIPKGRGPSNPPKVDARRRASPAAALGTGTGPRQPEFLQQLRVSNPIGEETLQRFQNRQIPPTKQQPSSKRLESLLRRRLDPSNYHHNFRVPARSQSATQSRLPSTSTKGSTDLVTFFQQRLSEHKADNNRAQQTAWVRRAGGLQAAKDQVQTAQKGIDATKEPSLEAYPSLNRRNGPHDAGISAKPTRTSTASVSLIGQYVAELKRRNKAEKQSKQIGTGADDVSLARVPSWRKSVVASNRRKQLDSSSDPRSSVPSPGPTSPANVMQDQQKAMAIRLEEERRETPPPPPTLVEVALPNHEVTIRELSKLSSVKASKIMQVLQDLGALQHRNCSTDLAIESEVAEMVLLELDVKFSKEEANRIIDDHEQLMDRRRGSEGNDVQERVVDYTSLPPRAPVVCIMGHVDHGKTTLMDALRRRSQAGLLDRKQKKKKSRGKKRGGRAAALKGDVAGTEAGGITQVVSAFQVPFGEQEHAITFLDTPGHAAFSAMRNSGSHAADILLLVIAADDGVQPQTIEIINTFKSIAKESAGGITMVVAMSKTDKPGIDVIESKAMIFNQLLEHGICPEGVSDSDGAYGSPVQFFPISAKTGDGLDDLVEGLALQSEVMDLRADVGARGEGIVMDSRIEQGLGVVVDAIIRWGCIQPGDVVVSATSVGKVRLLKDVNDGSLRKGLPSQPVRIVGFRSTPRAGDPLICVESEQKGNDLAEKRLATQTREVHGAGERTSSFSQVQVSGCESMTSMGTERRLERYDLSLDQDSSIRIPIILKASADGSVSAAREALQELAKLSSFNINVDTIAEGVGPLSTSEIEMARESDAGVFCFDIKNQDKTVLAMAEATGVKIHEFDVIYALLDEAEEVFTTYLPAVPVETVHGKATVEAVFSINGGKDLVAGLKVLEGFLYKSSVESDRGPPVRFRVIRGGVNVTMDANGIRATSLKKFKEDVETVRHGEECGLGLSGPVEYKEGDVIECFSIELRKSFTGA